ncbi:uncharacterized protein BO80DRAFT_144273 [Aspergillus ibericus CBS 121593]|uniref:Uncharacterized protein n=1 Tax=Aspergillus ibericus CBS 121593 TaxID=1448316 RepID=A0A395GU18_9EURO|nr:hypothetical protein BO80DRAFT_144273 [Aspergillus ibericus CBS 121593]RAK99070.1 hypothetical protein BO80DRAFT_144273 [Aspergillus ibericus CBS 121593]
MRRRWARLFMKHRMPWGDLPRRVDSRAIASRIRPKKIMMGWSSNSTLQNINFPEETMLVQGSCRMTRPAKRSMAQLREGPLVNERLIGRAANNLEIPCKDSAAREKKKRPQKSRLHQSSYGVQCLRWTRTSRSRCATEPNDGRSHSGVLRIVSRCPFPSEGSKHYLLLWPADASF